MSTTMMFNVMPKSFEAVESGYETRGTLKMAEPQGSSVTVAITREEALAMAEAFAALVDAIDATDKAAQAKVEAA
jgi:hypothetical protein